MKEKLCILSLISILLFFCFSNLAVGASVNLFQIERYPRFLEQVPSGSIIIPMKITDFMLDVNNRVPFFVSFLLKKGYSRNDFSIIFYGPDKEALAAFLPEMITGDAYDVKVPGVTGFWSYFKTSRGKFYVSIIHRQGDRAINLLNGYHLSNWSSDLRPIISLICKPPKGNNVFTGHYRLRVTCDVTWAIGDSKPNREPVRAERHGTRTQNVEHIFSWDRIKQDNTIADEGDYLMGISAKPTKITNISPDVQGRPIQVTK